MCGVFSAEQESKKEENLIFNFGAVILSGDLMLVWEHSTEQRAAWLSKPKSVDRKHDRNILERGTRCFSSNSYYPEEVRR